LHQQQALLELLGQQLALERGQEQLLLFYRRQPKQQQRSLQPKRGTWSWLLSLKLVKNNFREIVIKAS
jgi:hypothetical protein